jgi:hypothetical protein
VGSTTKVKSTKEWSINFNKEVDELSLKDKIFICRKGTNVNFPIIIQLSEDKKNIKIKHNTPFELGENYILYISKDINSINRDINLRISVKLDFIILN